MLQTIMDILVTLAAMAAVIGKLRQNWDDLDDPESQARHERKRDQDRFIEEAL